jgi:beta-galactosidase
MARNALSHLGRGADAILFFQWRASRRGAEKFHSAMLPHAGPDSRLHHEVVELGSVLAALTEVRGTQVPADVAIWWDWESLWAQDLEWRPSQDLDPRAQVRAWYEHLWRRNTTTDLAGPTTDLDRYRVVLAPASYLLTRDSADRLGEYVEHGGHLVVGPFSGVVDQDDAVHPGSLNGALADLTGVRVEEFLPLRAGGSVRLSGGLGGRIWAEDLAVQDANVVLRYLDGPAADGAAVTSRRVGRGTVTYISTVLTPQALAEVLNPVLERAGLTEPRDLQAGLELLTRRGTDADYWFAINHGSAPLELTVNGVDLLSGENCTGTTKVAAGGTRILRLPRRG